MSHGILLHGIIIKVLPDPRGLPIPYGSVLSSAVKTPPSMPVGTLLNMDGASRVWFSMVSGLTCYFIGNSVDFLQRGNTAASGGNGDQWVLVVEYVPAYSSVSVAVSESKWCSRQKIVSWYAFHISLSLAPSIRSGHHLSPFLFD